MEVVGNNLMGVMKNVLTGQLNQLGGSEMSKKIKKTTGLNMEEALNNMEEKINKFGLNEEQVTKEAPKPEPTKEEKVEEAKIMEDVNAAMGGEESSEVIYDVLSQNVKGILLTNDVVLHRTDLGFTDNVLLNKVILAILLKLKMGFKMSGLIDGEKEDAIKAFLLNLSNKTNELKILSAGGVEFFIGTEKVFEANLPKIVPTDDVVFLEMSTKTNPFHVINDEMVDSILESFETK